MAGMNPEELEQLRSRRAANASGNKFIIIAVLGLFVLGGLGSYLWQESTHGPFSADAYIPKELGAAQAVAPDAVLVSLAASYVDETGNIQAAFSKDGRSTRAGHLVMRFRSASRDAGKPAATAVPLGAPVPDDGDTSAPGTGCPNLRVSAGLHGAGKQTTFGIETGWRDEGGCGDPLAGPVRCSVAAVWQRAIAAGAPHPAFADLNLRATAGDPKTGTWHFQITDHSARGRVAFQTDFPDDCT